MSVSESSIKGNELFSIRSGSLSAVQSVFFAIVHFVLLSVKGLELVCDLWGAAVDACVVAGCTVGEYAMTELYIKREIHVNARWALYETERADAHKQLLMVFTHLEVQRVGLATLRKKLELFQKLHLTLGNVVFYASQLLPSYNDKVAILFSLKSQKKLTLQSISNLNHPSKPLPTYHALITRCPVQTLKEYLSAAVRILRIFWEIHKAGFVHGNISLEGLLVCAGKLHKVQLVDLGDIQEVSTLGLASAPKVAGVGDVDVSFYKYSAPESTGRTGNTITQKSDIYSLGALLFELAAGIPPFVSPTEDPMELIHLHMTQAPPPLPSTLWPADSACVAQLTAIIHKMMDKPLSGRYQSLYGTILDLEAIQHSVLRQQPLTLFPVAMQDLRDEFHMPELRLYGREQECENILQFSGKLEARETGVILIGGPSGVGKSSLVRHVLGMMRVGRNGGEVSPELLTGKHDLIQHTPYSAVLEAFRSIVHRLLMAQGEDIQVWREKLDEALAPNGRVLIEVLPEIETILGPQPPVVALPPTENKIRFQRVLVSFLQVYLAQFPAVMFLDDMQWADPATISFLEALASDTTVNNLIIICAYRNDEVGTSHLFNIFMDSIQKKNPTTVTSITLEPISLQGTTQLVKDSFQSNSVAAHALAELAQAKTGGNPFFLGQFLKSMTQEKLIVFNYSTHEWEWDIQQLQATDYTDNVVELVLLKIRKLPDHVCIVTQYASCLGNKFDLPTLATVSQYTPEDVEASLTISVEAGFITPYTTLGNTDPTCKNYRFIHDRIQEEFYRIMDIQKRMETHLVIARLLIENGYSDSSALFTISHHYNFSADLIAKLPAEDPERMRLIEISFEAAKRAKQSSAMQSAVTALRTARKMFTVDSITTDYRRTFDVMFLLADCEHSSGNFNEAEILFSYLKDHANCNIDKAHVHLLVAAASESRGNMRDTVNSCFEALKVYGVETPKTPEEVKKAKAEVLALKRAKIGPSGAASDLARILPKTDESHDMMLEALYTLAASSFFLIGELGIDFFYGGVVLAVKLTLEYGVSPFSANACACFSGALALDALWEESYQFSKLAMQLQEVYPHPLSLPRVETNVTAFALWQQESLHACKETYMKAFQHGLEIGDIHYCLYSCINNALPTLDSGEHLDDCEVTCAQQLSVLRNLTLNKCMVDSHLGFSKSFKVLKGTTRVLGKYDDDFDFDENRNQLEKMQGMFFYIPMFSAIMITSLIFEEYDDAFAAEKKIPAQSVEGILIWYEHTVWRCLLYLATISAAYKDSKQIDLTDEQRARIKEVHIAMNRMELVQDSPTLCCKLTLIRAELARVEGKHVLAQELYDTAIESARNFAYQNVLGYANELAMRFYLSKKLDRAATSHFRKARAAYFSWGAYGKCKQLETKYSALMYGSNAPGGDNSATGPGLDFSSVLKAYQVISAEMDLTKLIGNMVKIVIQNTGAQKGILLVPDQEGKLFVEAVGEAGVLEVQRLHMELPVELASLSGNLQLSPPQLRSRALSPPPEMQPQTPADKISSPKAPAHSVMPPCGIVQFVYRTKTPVLLDDACQEGMFTVDNQVKTNKIRSVLCVPVLTQAKVVAILYLENNLFAGAFTSARLEVAQLLSSHIGISFENATLYKNLQSANTQLATKNKGLLELDRIKDQLLANTSHELRTPLNGIIGLAESMLDGTTGTLPQAACNNLSMIVSCGRRLSNLINDILDLSALKAGGLILHPKPVDIGKILEDVLFLSSHVIGTKELRLVNNTKDLPIMNVDGPRIQQVLQNIVGNAVKFTYNGSVTISSAISSDWVAITVADSGCGIPTSELDAIFEDFKQVDGSASREIGGTGLGLSIAKKLIEMHQGLITVQSKLDQGSVFTIHLPANLIVKPQEDTNMEIKSPTLRSQPQPIPPIQPQMLKPLQLESLEQLQPQLQPKTQIPPPLKHNTDVVKPTVLSVDDEPTNQFVVQKMLSQHYTVIKAMNGEEALNIIYKSAKLPDIVLLDVMMPKINGLEVCERVRQNYRVTELPIIMVSAKDQSAHVVEGFSFGANDYITKPIKKDELLARIQSHLTISRTFKMMMSKNNHSLSNSPPKNKPHKKARVDDKEETSSPRGVSSNKSSPNSNPTSNSNSPQLSISPNATSPGTPNHNSLSSPSKTRYIPTSNHIVVPNSILQSAPTNLIPSPTPNGTPPNAAATSTSTNTDLVLIPAVPIPKSTQTSPDLQPENEQKSANLGSEIKTLTTKLAVVKTMYSIKQMTIKFKLAGQAFYHQAHLEGPTFDQLHSIIVDRLKINSRKQIALVKDGDTLVAQDEDLEDGLCLEVHIPT